MKKARSSLPGNDDEDMRKRFGLGLSGVKADVLGAIEHDRMAANINGESSSNAIGPMKGDGFGLSGGLFGDSLAGGSRNGQVKQEHPKEVKLEDMDEEEL